MTGLETPLLTLQQVERRYAGPPVTTALRSCDLTVAAGEYLTLTGPSGSGKSTVLNIMGLLDRPTKGVYRLAGLDTGQLSESSRVAVRGRWIGFVFQAFHLMPYRDALSNVMLPLMYTKVKRAERRTAAMAILDKVGLTRQVGRPVRYLSGGEQQRVAIARALVGRPRLLLCDEPTGNLDSTNASGILDLLDLLNADGLTLCVVTHDPAVAARGQRTLSMRDGVVRATTSRVREARS